MAGTHRVGLRHIPAIRRIITGFCDPIRSANSPDADPYGIGGSSNVIWHCDLMGDPGPPPLCIYELSVLDFSVIKAGTGYADVGIGGDESVIWASHTGVNRIYELSTTDFSVIKEGSHGHPTVHPWGIGGDGAVIWHCAGHAVQYIYELKPADFSVIKSAISPSPSPGYARGIGGDINTIWLCVVNVKLIYELSPLDFSAIRTCQSPSTVSTGIGGDGITIWYCERGGDKIYELKTGYKKGEPVEMDIDAESGDGYVHKKGPYLPTHDAASGDSKYDTTEEAMFGQQKE